MSRSDLVRRIKVPPVKEDAIFMQLALDAGESVRGATGDNPWVGCVITHEGKIVATGSTQPPGHPHAEVMAIQAAESAGFDIRECELFVTLEPCATQGRTPPCSTLIIKKRPRRVVIAHKDPHPEVNGKGIEAIQNEGIPVELGLLASQAEKSLGDWLKRFSP
ncbi:MAG: bifunctional diaminohydroxyphosphoribosylaminopyrimidine deaminase/5-amino-6-(5-phosphoribosylamino)uracil reductase RibD [Deltaproteobacteria bacterium]|nr:bifunctional diaminohydroxyphosphoribosylaminopyrimidine deaminase/5-amino-6-(5-phosphoribosylamino)uracil reductase RibD [Deltaproteobacteria bacterium]